MKSFKSMGCYEFAALLICVFWFVGCGGSAATSASNARSNANPVTTMTRAISKYLFDVNSIEKKVQGFTTTARREGVVEAAIETWLNRLDSSDRQPSGSLMAKCTETAP